MRILSHILAGEDALTPWWERHRQEQNLQNRLRQMHPRALANAFFVIDARNNELQIGAVSGSIAARLKQLAPKMLSILQEEGWQFTGIRVVVQVRPAFGLWQKLVQNK